MRPAGIPPTGASPNATSWEFAGEREDFATALRFSKRYAVTVDSSGVATSHRRARYGQVRQILPYAGRRWVFATGRRGVIKGQLPAHFRLIINRVEMATGVQGRALVPDS